MPRVSSLCASGPCTEYLAKPLVSTMPTVLRTAAHSSPTALNALDRRSEGISSAGSPGLQIRYFQPKFTRLTRISGADGARNRINVAVCVTGLANHNGYSSPKLAPNTFSVVCCKEPNTGSRLFISNTALLRSMEKPSGIRSDNPWSILFADSLLNESAGPSPLPLSANTVL